MALKIINNQGVYELIGNVQGKNAISLQYHFEHLLFTTEKVILSLDNVEKIDNYGVQVFSNLYRRAIKSNKIFYIIRSNKKEINKAFGKVNYMLRNDFL